jgi:alanine-synthesizing transaminase
MQPIKSTSPVQPINPGQQKELAKSNKLANVCYDIRGPVLQRARQMEDEGQRIIKLKMYQKR